MKFMRPGSSWLFPGLLLVSGVFVPANASVDVSAGLGVGYFAAPVSVNAADGSNRANFVVEMAGNYPIIPELSVGLVEIGSFGGGDVSLAVSDKASETILNSATAVVLTRVWESDKFQGDVGVSLGAGPFFLSDRIEHSGAVLSSSGWAPMGLAQCVWSSALGQNAFYRLRLAWIWASTNLPVDQNPGVRHRSDWSRLELTLGFGLKL
jgi:hypothetical protein